MRSIAAHFKEEFFTKKPKPDDKQISSALETVAQVKKRIKFDESIMFLAGLEPQVLFSSVGTFLGREKDTENQTEQVDVEKLLAQLKSPEDSERSAAAIALGDSKDKSAAVVGALFDSMKDKVHPFSCQRAARTPT